MPRIGPIGLNDVRPSNHGLPRMDSKGTYSLHAMAGGDLLELQRMYLPDPTGTLSIGCTPRPGGSTVFKRLSALRASVARGLTTGWYPHVAGWHLHVFDLLGSLGLTIDDLVVFYDVGDGTMTGDQAAAAEADLLLSYRAHFGDLPPGNLSAGHIGNDTLAIHGWIRDFRGSTDPDRWFDVR